MMDNYLLLAASYITLSIFFTFIFIYIDKVIFKENYATNAKTLLQMMVEPNKHRDPIKRLRLSQFHLVLVFLATIIIFIWINNGLLDKYIINDQGKIPPTAIFYSSLFLIFPTARSIASIVRMKVILTTDQSINSGCKKHSGFEQVLANFIVVIVHFAWMISIVFVIFELKVEDIYLDSWVYIDIVIISLVISASVFVANSNGIKNIFNQEKKNNKHIFYVVACTSVVALLLFFISVNNILYLSGDMNYFKRLGIFSNTNLISFSLLLFVVSIMYKVFVNKNLYIVCVFMLSAFAYDIYLTQYFDSPYYFFGACTITSFVALGMIKQPINTNE